MQLIEIEDSDAIVTPVVIEFLCGARDKQELSSVRAFLRQFDVVDRRKITRRGLARGTSVSRSECPATASPAISAIA